MDKQYIFLLCLELFILSLATFIFINHNPHKDLFQNNNQVCLDQIESCSSTEVYQGPLPEGYDEQHFRSTGETKLLMSVEN